MAIVIADAGPLIALAKIEQLSILRHLFGNIQITQAVGDECLRNGAKDGLRIQQALQEGWLHCIENPTFKHLLSKSLGHGEQTSIEYALQLEAPCLLILDDRLARKQALDKQLKVVGTAALLFAAQRKGLINSAEQMIEVLNKAGYRISPAVVATLKTATDVQKTSESC